MKSFKKIENSQKILAFVLIGGGVIFLIFVFTLFFGEEEDVQENHKIKGNYTKKFETGRRQVDDNEVFVDQVEKEQKQLKSSLSEVHKKISDLTDMLQESMKDSSRKDVEIEELKRELETLMSGPQSSGPGLPMETYKTPAGYGPPLQSGEFYDSSLRASGGLKKITLKLQAKPKQKEKYKKTLDNYISANEYAIGRLVSTVYASTSTESANNPEPIKFKLTNRGILPQAFGRDLEQCYVSGAAYGDASSERVKVRLERLSCIEKKTGEKIDVGVSGYVSGEDGANGMRGAVISRTGKIMRNTAALGFLNGMTKFFSTLAQSNTYPRTPFGQTDSLKTHEMMMAGSAEGVGSGLDLIIKKYAKLLDRLDPVIYIANGRKATIHFTKGVDLNQTEYRKATSEKNNQVRDQVIGKSDITKEDLMPWMKEGESA